MITQWTIDKNDEDFVAFNQICYTVQGRKSFENALQNAIGVQNFIVKRMLGTRAIIIHILQSNIRRGSKLSMHINKNCLLKKTKPWNYEKSLKTQDKKKLVG